MKKTWMKLSLLMMLIVSFSMSTFSLAFASNQNPVTIKLVLGEGVTLNGYTGQDDETIFQRNVVTLEGVPGLLLPTPAVKSGATFLSWVYAEGATLVQVTAFPLSSGAVYFPYFSEATLASVQPNQQQVSLYLDATFWAEANPVFYAYTFATETAGAWPATQLTSLGDNLYTVSVPSGSTKVIFSRYSAPVSEGGEKWNQTADLTFHPTVNLFVINSWDQNQSGYWSVFQS